MRSLTRSCTYASEILGKSFETALISLKLISTDYQKPEQHPFI